MSRFTLPGETGMENKIKELISLWGVDAIRDSDGTALSDELLGLGVQIYSTLCLIRMDNEWIKAHPMCRQQIYLMSERFTAFDTYLSIDIMQTVFAEQFEPNIDVDIHKYWQVMDRTTGEEVTTWNYNSSNKTVEISNAIPYHQYDVSFLAYQKWEPVSMYNHITNGWTKEHRIPVDVRHEDAGKHVLEILEDWLKNHPKTDVVRFTTFIYCFDLIYNQFGKEKQVNWFGYAACASPLALEMFEKEYGYSLRPEDLTDNRMYNTPFKNPTKKYLDWMDFNQRFVASFAKKCVDLVHKYNKKAIMFLGDHWAGTEPYGKYFPSIGLDAVVGAAGDGVTTRMIADIPVKETEARFYPYFFPDVFHEGGNPVEESQNVWIKCRRSLLQKPMERMGYGGYLSLACKFPDFIEHVKDVAGQFRMIYDETQGKGCDKTGIKVYVLNTWGKIRTWQTHQVAHSLWNQRCYSYLGAFEALSGLPVDVEFISFDDIRQNGIPEDASVILNAGDAGTAWSGDDNWADERIQALIRKWVRSGGGFLGIGEPTAHRDKGQLFVLQDVLGVQRELGLTASCNKPVHNEKVKQHFITRDLNDSPDYGEGMGMIYQASPSCEILDVSNLSCSMAANEYGSGRAFYMAGCPYDNVNSRILFRALMWLTHKENEWVKWLTDNVNVECNYIDGKAVISNNSANKQKVNIGGSVIELKPYELKLT
ncbi:1,3-beta-galactosyl-N-acetylhexosamine phosphorylase [Lachnospiraceae bacterium G11]|nr:1,3-beta-galactosyl-N-acetylhexosamine phosphorylase [Lachnospiraceae bacterium G11]